MGKFLLSALLVSLLAACSSEEVKDQPMAPVESRSAEEDQAAADKIAVDQPVSTDLDGQALGANNQSLPSGLNNSAPGDAKAIDGSKAGSVKPSVKPADAKVPDNKMGGARAVDAKTVDARTPDKAGGNKMVGGGKMGGNQLGGAQPGATAGQYAGGQQSKSQSAGVPGGGQFGNGGTQSAGVPSNQQSGAQQSGAQQGGTQQGGQYAGASQSGGQQAAVPQTGGNLAGGGRPDGSQIADVRQGDASMDDGKPKGAKPLDPRLKDPNHILSKRSVYYDLDRYDVQDQYKPMVEAHAKYLVSEPDVNVIVQGNCDERGSREYNIALGHRRAENVRKMMNVLGVPDKQIETVSFGEEKPRATCHDEACWKENRRSDIVYQGE